MIELRNELKTTDEEINDTCKSVSENLQQYMSNDEVFAVELMFREALVNAQKHAHKYTSSKIIKYKFHSDENDLFISVTNEGDGFDWKRKLEASESISENAKSGRGMIIFRQYADEVLYDEKGTTLFLRKRLQHKPEIQVNEIFYLANGDITASNAEEIKNELWCRVASEASGNQLVVLVVDLKNTKMIDSSGIGLLVSLNNNAKKTNGYVKLSNTSDNIKNLFKMMRLDKHLKIE